MNWRRIEHVFMFTVICFIALYMAAGVALQFLPVSLWVEYHKIYSPNEFNIINKDIPMVTELTVHHNVHVKYNDILRCKKDARSVWTYKGDQSTKHVLLEKAPRYEAPWTYHQEAYDIEGPDECYIESTIKVEIPFGVEKYIKHNTPKFYMIEEPKDEG